MSPLFVSATIFVLLGVAGVAACTALSSRYQPLGERFSDMKVRARYGALAPDEIEEKGVAQALFRWAVERLPEPKLDTPQAKSVARLLVRAGYLASSTPRTFQFMRLLAALGGTILATAASAAMHAQGARPVILVIAGATLGAWLPYFMLVRKAHARQSEIASQLSDALDLLVVCVEAGLGINEAIKVVGSETERQGQVIGQELGLVSAELTAGSSLGQALRGLAERTSVQDIKPLAATMIQSEQLGAQMGPILRSISDGLRNSRRLRAEEAAQKITIKILFPLVFFVLPSMLSMIAGPALIQIMRTLGSGH